MLSYLRVKEAAASHSLETEAEKPPKYSARVPIRMCLLGEDLHKHLIMPSHVLLL